MAEAVKRFDDEGERGGVLDSDGVESAVIHTWSKGTVCLPCEQDGCTPRGRRLADEPLCFMFVEP